MQDLAGKVAVVTGGGGGIGRALGERFLAEGMRVVLADIDEPLLDATVAELGARHDDVVGVVTDVSLPDSVEHLRDATLERFGSVHLVCNNAGIPSGSDGALWQHHVNDWRWAVDVNVFGVINGINTFVPVLLEQGGPGHVVNTSSSNGTFAPLSNSAVYATTKAAVTNITECLWGQMRSADLPVQVSLLLPSTRTPGALDTGIWRPGRNRPDRYARPGQAPVEGRDALTPFVEQLERHGQELTFAPLEEVADIALDGILTDQFWIYLPGEKSAETIERARRVDARRRAARVPHRAVAVERPQDVSASDGRAFQDQMHDNFCWGCGADNPDGLHLKSRWQGDESVATWQPHPEHAAGPRHFLNGGIIATLLDCHGVCTAIVRAYERDGRAIGSAPEIWCATAAMSIQFERPCPIDLPVTLHGREVATEDRFTTVECTLGSDGKVRARASVRAVRVPDSWRHGTGRAG